MWFIIYVVEDFAWTRRRREVADIDKAIGERIRRIRRSKRIGQVELAELSGVAQGGISAIELGKREAYPSTLERLAAALGVPVAELFREEAPPKVPPPPKTPLTDEPESDFDARFGAADLEGAEGVKEKVGAEFDKIQGYIRGLKAAGIGGDDLRLKQARRRLREAKRRTLAATSRATALALNAEFGRNLPVYDTLAAYAGQAQEVAAEIEAENTEAHPEAS
jgi:transcriptional regulator with XRE-family HTH domain